MKNVYLVGPNNSLSHSLFLPYSIGCIAAYSFRDEEIKSSYSLGEFIFTKLPIEEAVKKTVSPFLVGFSCYMWNVEYNLSLALEIKKKYPDAVIVFGGPHVPDDVSFLKEYGFIDILIHGEGEVAFFEILKTLDNGGDFRNIYNISYRENNEYIKTPYRQICDLHDLPSPYSEGFFDSIINSPEYQGIQFDAIIETNRGCPYKCAYCCWAGGRNTFREFPYERVRNDLLWMAKNKISYCICADSNFGILSRDEEIVDYLVSLKREFGYPQKFETTAAKNKDSLTFRINKKLDSVNLNRGISVAVQSMSPKVLEIVGRKNMSVDNLSEQLALYRNAGMFTYTDIILGLPGETFDSFSSGLFDVIEAGQHNSININRLEFLPNTLMYSEEFRTRHGIKTVRSHLCQNHSRADEDLCFSSRSELVVETETMSRNDWRKALRMSTCVQSFHGFGLLRFIAIYLRKSREIPYKDFYLGLFGWIENESKFIKSKLDYVCRSIDTFLSEKGNLSFSDGLFGDIYWSFEEALFLCLAAEAESFYSEINTFLSSLVNTDEEIIRDLFDYQKNIITLPSQSEQTLPFGYDWHEFFENVFDSTAVCPKKGRYELTLKGNNLQSWSDYAKEIVWYGKRDDKTVRRPKNI